MQFFRVPWFPGMIWGTVLLVLAGNVPHAWCVCPDGSIRLHCARLSGARATPACCSAAAVVKPRPKPCCGNFPSSHPSTSAHSAAVPAARVGVGIDNPDKPGPCRCAPLAGRQVYQPGPLTALPVLDYFVSVAAIDPIRLAAPLAGARIQVRWADPDAPGDLIIALHCLLI